MADKFNDITDGSNIDPDAFYPTPITAPLVFRSPATLATLRTIGGGPRYCKAGRFVTYRGSDLIAWLTGQTFSSTAEDARVTPRACQKPRSRRKNEAA